MRKLVLILFVALVAVFVVNPVFAVTKNAFKGTWEYKVPDAPYEYSSGKIIFAEAAGGQQTVSIKFNDGTEIKAKDVKIEGTTFSFTTDVDYNTVKVTGKLVDGKIAGKVDTPDGTMEVTAMQSVK